MQAAVAKASSSEGRCVVRDDLGRQYRQLLADYNNKLADLMTTVGIEHATTKTHRLYRACLCARLAMEKHEAEHGCMRD